jgi:hypothetical protein
VLGTVLAPPHPACFVAFGDPPLLFFAGHAAIVQAFLRPIKMGSLDAYNKRRQRRKLWSGPDQLQRNLALAAKPLKFDELTLAQQERLAEKTSTSEPVMNR